jgi:hypothetical protein
MNVTCVKHAVGHNPDPAEEIRVEEGPEDWRGSQHRVHVGQRQAQDL